MKRMRFALIAALLVSLLSVPLWAADSSTENEVLKAVEEAVAILEKDGSAGLEKVSKIRFGDGNYVFVNDLDGKTLMHIKPHLIGQVLLGLKDDTGKRFFAEFIKVVKSNSQTQNGKTVFTGKGWVSYRWPKPGEKTFSPKISYVQGCLMGDANVYVGAGIYK